MTALLCLKQSPAFLRVCACVFGCSWFKKSRNLPYILNVVVKFSFLITWWSKKVSIPICLSFMKWLSTSFCFLITVLNQLPLPSPLPATTTKSLLFNGRIAEEVNCLLACRDENLVSQLVHSLNQVSTDHMYVFWTSNYIRSLSLFLEIKINWIENDVRIWCRFLLALLSRWLLYESQMFQSVRILIIVWQPFCITMGVIL